MGRNGGKDGPCQRGKARNCVSIGVEYRKTERESEGHEIRTTGLSLLKAHPISVLLVIKENKFSFL